MKKVILFVFLFVFIGQTDIFAKAGGMSGSRSSVRSTSRISTGGSKIHSSGTSSGSKAVRPSSKTGSKVGTGGSKGIRSYNKSSTPKSIAKYTSHKPFARPRTVTTSKFSHHQVTFVYTRPVVFYNPYHTHYYLYNHNNVYRPDSAKVDTTAFPGFGKGKSGGAGASASFSSSLPKHESKDTLEITELEPINYLSDFSGIIPDQDEAKINSIIRQYKKKTGVEMAVLTIPTLGDEIDMEDYIQIIFDKWGVGEAGVNNGIMLVISSEDEIVRIQPGYGMEEFLPDAICREIEDKIMIPLCEKDQWESSITGSIGDIIKRLGTKPVEIMKQELADRKKKEHEEMINGIYTTLKVLGVIALLLFLFFYIKSKRN